MIENVNYEDNLFYLSRMIDLASKSLLLNLDRSLFYRKRVDDIRFIDRSLQVIFKELSENRYLINRNQYLHTLMKKKKSFLDLLESMDNQNESAPEETDRIDLERFREIHRGDIADIREILSLTDNVDEGQDIISADELNFLMAPGLLGDEDEE